MAAATRTAREPRTAAILVLLVAGALVLLSFAELTWYKGGGGADSAGSSGFADLHHNVDQLQVPIAAAYFDWLSWVLLVGVVVIGAAANLPSPAADGLRVLGFLLGLAGVAATFYAMDQLFHAQGVAGGTSGIWHNSTYGLWAALAGYGIAAFAAARGPRGGSDTIGR
jgi:hypothetical protein